MRTLRRALLAVGVLATVALTACAPPPPAPATVTCRGTSAEMTVSPGLVEQAQPVELALTRRPKVKTTCTDTSGRGITGYRLTATQIDFEALACFNEPGTVGFGDGTFRWSDGTTSRFLVLAELRGPFDGQLSILFETGHLAGSYGYSTFEVSPLEGSCATGITREALRTGELVINVV